MQLGGVHTLSTPPRDEEFEMRAESYPFSLTEVAELQWHDPEVSDLKFAVSRQLKDTCPINLKSIYDKFSLKGRFLVYTHKNRSPVPVISRHFLITLATQIHGQYNHIGRAKLLVLLQKFCWSPAMSFLIGNLTKSCPLCQANKADTGKLAPPLLRREILSPYDLVCIDILTLTKTKRGNCCLLIIADHCSKWL